MLNIIGNYKLKQQWDTITYLSERLTSKILTISNAGEDMEQQELSFAGGNAKWYSHIGRFWQFLANLNIVLPYGPGIVLLGININPNELKTYVHTET